MLNLGTWEWIAFFALSFLAEIIGTMGGFGSSLFFVPLASFFFNFQVVLGITALFHVFSNLSKISLFRSAIDWKIILQIGIPSVVFVVLGSLLSSYLSKEIASLSIGIFLIIFSLLLLLLPHLKLKANMRNAFGGGALSGFLAGLLGTGGAIRGLTLTAFHIEKDIFIASSAVIDMAVDSSRLVVYAAKGYLSLQTLWLIPLLVVIAFAGSYIGKIILQRISQNHFRNISLWLILLTGIVSLYQAYTLAK